MSRFFIMTRLEKIQLALDKGITYDHLNGNVYGVKGNVMTKKTNGYTSICLWHIHKRYYLYAHQFAFFIMYGKTPKYIDHINGDKTDNRISNLREVTKQENAFNMKNVKGYHFSKRDNKYIANIMLNGKNIQLGSFDNKKDARLCYLKNKNKYHKFNN